MSIQKEHFGQMPDGREVSLYKLTGRRISATVTDLGAVLVSLYVPDRAGNADDVVLGFDTVERYLENPYCYGAIIAPCGNRIDKASFTLDGTEYHIPLNNGTNCLHSGKKSYVTLWDAQMGDNDVTFSLLMKDLEEGFPGNRMLHVTYSLTADDGIMIHYYFTSDKRTIFSPTNHSYFNLAGQEAGSVLNHRVKLYCSNYTVVDEALVPTGEIASVKGTPLDFTQEKTFGEDIGADFAQLRYGGGYDHNFVIDGYQDDGSLRPAARVTEPESGRVMEVLTTMPSMQVYTANGMAVEQGKGGITYGDHGGFAMETQYYPDSIHHDNFPCCIFGPDRPLDSKTVYRFPNL